MEAEMYVPGRSKRADALRILERAMEVLEAQRSGAPGHDPGCECLCPGMRYSAAGYAAALKAAAAALELFYGLEPEDGEVSESPTSDRMLDRIGDLLGGRP